MAEEISEEITADVRPFVNALREGDRAIAEFAAANHLALDSIQHMRDDAIAAGYGLDDMSTHASAAARDLTELGAAEDHAASEARALAADEAVAAHEVEKLGDAANRSRAQLDANSLTAHSTLMSVLKLGGGWGALIGMIAGVAPVFGAAALGLAGIGVAAYGAYSNVQPAVQALNKLNDLAPGTRQYAQTLAQVNAYMGALSPQAQAFARSLSNVANAFQKWSNSMTPLVQRVLTPFLNLIPQLLNIVQRLSQAVAGPLITVAHQLGAALSSSGFQQFLSTMISLIGPAMSAIARLAGTLLSVLGHALEALAPLAVPFLDMISKLVSSLQGPLIAALAGFQRLLASVLSALLPLLPGLAAVAQALIGDVAQAFISLAPILGQIVKVLGPDLIKILNDLLPVIANLVTPNSAFVAVLAMIPGVLRAILPLITGLASILSHPLFAQMAADALTFLVAGRAVIGILGLIASALKLVGISFTIGLGPIGWAITALIALGVAFYELWQHSAAFRDFFKDIGSGIMSALSPAIGWVKNVLNDLTRWWTDHGHTVVAVAKAAYALVAAVIGTDIKIIETVVKVGLALIVTAWRVSWDVLRGVVETVWRIVAATVRAGVKIIQDLIDAGLALIHGHWRTAWNLLVNAVQTAMNLAGTVLRTAVKGFIDILFQAGKDLITGLIRGVQSMLGGLWGVVKSIGSGIGSVFHAILHFGSPSRVFFDYGVDTIQGYIDGLRSMLPLAKSVMGAVASTVQSPWAGAQSAGLIPSRPSVGGTYSPSSAGAGASPSGNITIMVDGRKLFEVLQAQTYWYNIRNSGTVTGVVKPR